MRRIILRMRQADRFVPIINIAEESKGLIVLGSPPPHRDKLKINAGGLSELLDMVGGGQDLVKLGFKHWQNTIDAAPSDVGQLSIVTKKTQFREEETKKPKRVIYDPRHQELKITIDYEDEETITPAATARNLSKRLSYTLLAVPAEKYLTNFFEDLDGGLDEKSVTGRAAELSSFTASVAFNILFAPIAYGIFSAINNAPAPLEAIGVLTLTNMLSSTNDLRLAVNLLNGKLEDKKQVPKAMAVAEKPLRVIYPVSLVHELVLPTANILAHNIKSSAPLLKSSGD